MALAVSKSKHAQYGVEESLAAAGPSGKVTAYQRRAGYKLYCARTAMEVIRRSRFQIMGGRIYILDEARVSRFWRDVRCERIGGGTDEV
ncbi:hypothetical protein KCP73_24565 [Salmonella enterica subsp. enterica]|nr:hypothetical protein KCP73_24565 [Salmonella enterica subsp. enterica]